MIHSIKLETGGIFLIRLKSSEKWESLHDFQDEHALSYFVAGNIIEQDQPFELQKVINDFTNKKFMAIGNVLKSL